MRSARRTGILLSIALSLAGSVGPSRADERPSAPAFPVRIVKIGGAPGAPETRAHLEFAASAGFNAVWVYSHDVGRWSAQGAPEGPYLDPAFVELARWCGGRGLRLFVSVNPIADSGGSFVFDDPEGARRIRGFFRLLRRTCGIRDFVLSFDDQERELRDPADIARFGKSAAAAHLSLARRVLRRTGRDGSVWLCAAAYSDWHLVDRRYAAYSLPFLAGLAELPARIGLVWTGPDTISESITRADVVAVRSKLGGRRILLYDNYPVNDDASGQALALILGPLRQRDPLLREVISAYLACPMTQLAASRLPLLTTADFLRDPDRYDPDESWARAIQRLAGDDPVALDAVKTQAMEWGGWVETMNYHPAEDSDPRALAEELDNPGLMATWGYTLRRYPERMQGIARATDEPFRNDVLAAMARRYAVSRVLPAVLQLRARRPPEGRTAADLVDEIRRERASFQNDPNAAGALDAFLDAAGLLEAFRRD